MITYILVGVVAATAALYASAVTVATALSESNRKGELSKLRSMTYAEYRRCQRRRNRPRRAAVKKAKV